MTVVVSSCYRPLLLLLYSLTSRRRAFLAKEKKCALSIVGSFRKDVLYKTKDILTNTKFVSTWSKCKFFFVLAIPVVAANAISIV